MPPGSKEGMPNALIESIYYGLHCLCSKLPNIQNFLNIEISNLLMLILKKKIGLKELIKILSKLEKKKLIIQL